MAYEAMCERNQRRYCKTSDFGGFTGPELLAANTPSLRDANTRAAPVNNTVSPEMAAHLAKIDAYELASYAGKCIGQARNMTYVD